VRCFDDVLHGMRAEDDFVILATDNTLQNKHCIRNAVCYSRILPAEDIVKHQQVRASMKCADERER